MTYKVHSTSKGMIHGICCDDAVRPILRCASTCRPSSATSKLGGQLSGSLGRTKNILPQLRNRFCDGVAVIFDHKWSHRAPSTGYTLGG